MSLLNSGQNINQYSQNKLLVEYKQIKTNTKPKSCDLCGIKVILSGVCMCLLFEPALTQGRKENSFLNL